MMISNSGLCIFAGAVLFLQAGSLPSGKADFQPANE